MSNQGSGVCCAKRNRSRKACCVLRVSATQAAGVLRAIHAASVLSPRRAPRRAHPEAAPGRRRPENAMYAFLYGRTANLKKKVPRNWRKRHAQHFFSPCVEKHCAAENPCCAARNTPSSACCAKPQFRAKCRASATAT